MSAVPPSRLAGTWRLVYRSRSRGNPERQRQMSPKFPRFTPMTLSSTKARSMSEQVSKRSLGYWNWRLERGPLAKREEGVGLNEPATASETKEVAITMSELRLRMVDDSK